MSLLFTRSFSTAGIRQAATYTASTRKVQVAAMTTHLPRAPAFLRARRFSTTDQAATATDVEKAVKMQQELEKSLKRPSFATNTKKTRSSSSGGRDIISILSSSSQIRSSEFRQSIINAAAAFLAVILAAQGLKNAHALRKTQRELEACQEVLEEKRRLLHGLTNSDFSQPLAHDIVMAMSQRGRISDEQRRQQVISILSDHFQKRVGQAGLTPEEADKESLTQLTALASGNKDDSDALLERLVVEQATQTEKNDAVVKRKVFAF